ncbi:type I secretion system permease/ATPase [Sulfurospirillum arcachonense]|uniref:type I secretion system permease/ATPase n=1 Tax=Sulfurospirillum arcachonense TaxID=57666 RepID=UPI00046829EE|nr:type I secretion system permease/ATPase [Sulfurospirillum arcachonense]
MKDNFYVDPLLQCLVIITRLNNQPFTAESLIDGLPTAKGEASPELFSLDKPKSGFSRAAKRAGFSSKLVQRDLKEISSLVLPCILILKDNKACILDEFDMEKKYAKIILPDYEEAEIWVNIDELNEEYLGYAFYIKKEYRNDEKEDFVLNNNKTHWFWGTLWKSKKIYTDVVFASLVINIFVLASPLFVMNVYDRVVPNNAIETLWVLAIGVVVVYGLDTVLKFIRAYFLEVAGKKSDIIMSSIIFEKVMGLNMAVRPKSVGSFANNLKEFESIRGFFTSTTVATLIDLPFVLIFLFVIHLIAGSIVWAPISIMLAILIYTLFIKGPLHKSIESSYEAAAHKNSVLIESLNNIETIKTMGASGNAQYQWEEASGEIANKGLTTRILSNSVSTMTALFIQLNTVAVIVYGVYLIQEMELTMGGLIATVILSSRAISPLGQVASLVANYEHTKTAYKNLSDIMKMPVDRPEGKEFVHRVKFNGFIEFQNVSFSYPDEDKKALDNVSFKVFAGERVGIAGKIGSGKTTLEKLILGLYKPESGTILIDGIDINQIDPADLRKNIGYVPQEVNLFRGSVKNNIIYKAPYINDKQMLVASKLAGVDDFVKLHPKGYDMPVGERGDGLSGGQKQGIAIARAFLLDAPIMLLDEPTNSVDNVMESKIRVNLAKNIVGKTTILITHKNSILELVDRLIILDNGKLIVDGKRDEVLQKLNAPKKMPREENVEK